MDQRSISIRRGSDGGRGLDACPPPVLSNQLGELIESRMKCLGQQRQQDKAGFAPNTGGLVCTIGALIGRMDAEDMSFGLQGTPQLGCPHIRRSRDNHRLYGGISQHLFEIRYQVGRQIPSAQVLKPHGGAGIAHQRVPARRRQRPGHGQPVLMIAQQCKTHAFFL